MKKTYAFIGLFLIGKALWAQEIPADLLPMHQALQQWDPVRGPWLAASIEAMAVHKAIPDRTFPEDYTPYEMLAMIPSADRRVLQQQAQGRPTQGPNAATWQVYNQLLSHSFCEFVIGRSYGDPHMKSFDKANYSFQTVGEFVLARSADGAFEVQTRQRAQDDNFSLNAAVAMNVGGDRLCFYAAEKPDGMPGPLRLNGEQIQLQGRSYYLPHGGVVRLDGRNYTIVWPSGENTVIDMRTSGVRGFVNVTCSVFSCDQGVFSGLLGNNNLNPDDDFNRIGSTANQQFGAGSMSAVYAFNGSTSNARAIGQYAELEYQAFLVKDFAEDWRVTNQNTLFDYAPGMSTTSFTDRSFPRVHMNLAQMDPNNREQARQRCLQMGVPADELGGCIFDQGYLNIPPNNPPVPNVPKPTSKPLTPIERPALNNNNHQFTEGKTPTSLPIGTTTGASKTPDTSTPTKTPPAVDPVHRPVTTEPVNRPQTSPVQRPNAPVSPKPSVTKPAAPVPTVPKPAAPKPSVSPIKVGKG
ncbi:MAG: hypothetical protein RLZZ301_597 [Bacteroidota bacterium]|jgi:hypothetical protein